MNKKQKAVLTYVLVGIALIGLLAYLDVIPFSIDTQQLVKSISYVHQFSNKVDLNNDMFKILLQVGTGTDEIIASMDNSEFNKVLRDEGLSAASTETDISFSSNIQKETVKYGLIPGQGTGEVFTVYYVQRQIDPSIFTNPPKCKIDYSDARIIFDRDFTKGDRFCIIERGFGRFGNLQINSVQVDIAYQLM